jgi:hypothetical protein
MLRLTLLVLLAGSLSGCAFFRMLGIPWGEETPYNPKAESGDISVRRNIQFQDIPVPLGFVLQREDTFSFKGKTFRFGRFHYRGVWSLRKTSEFYRDQMPLSGWEFVDAEAPERFIVVQVWGKGRERCRLEIESGLEYIHIYVRLYTESAADSAAGSF